MGTGLGKVMVVKTTGDKYPVVRQSKVVGEVTSLALRGEGHQFFTGTKSGHVNRFNVAIYYLLIKLIVKKNLKHFYVCLKVYVNLLFLQTNWTVKLHFK